MPFVFYHNPRCSKSRAALQLIEARGLRPEIVLYLQTPPSATELKKIIQRLGLSPRAFIRTCEPVYDQLGLAAPDITDAALIKAMVQNPVLIQRPILVSGNRAIIGRPPEKVLEILT